jgi:hypothetical protein
MQIAVVEDYPDGTVAGDIVEDVADSTSSSVTARRNDVIAYDAVRGAVVMR